MVKRLSTMQETQVWSLGWEDPLEKAMAAHSSILAWKIPWTADPGRLPSMGSQRVGHDWATSLSTFTLGYEEGNGNPLQYSWPGKSHGWRSLVGWSPWGRWVRHNWVTSLSLFTFMHWGKKWQPTPVFLPGESQGRGSLVGCHLWGCTESDMTEAS